MNSKFDEILSKINSRLNEDNNPVSNVPPTNNNQQQQETDKYDANHPIIQQLAKSSNPNDVVKLLQTLKVKLPQPNTAPNQPNNQNNPPQNNTQTINNTQQNQ